MSSRSAAAGGLRRKQLSADADRSCVQRASYRGVHMTRGDGQT